MKGESMLASNPLDLLVWLLLVICVIVVTIIITEAIQGK